jgi:hypothetical protein
MTLQHLVLDHWEFPAEVRELSRQVKVINAPRIAQLSLTDQREKGLGGFSGADLDDGLCPFMSGKQSGIAARERLRVTDFVIWSLIKTLSAAAVAEWQAAVLEALLAPTKSPFRTRNGLATLRIRRWLDPSVDGISDEIACGVRESGIPFNSPSDAVGEYLKQLERLGFVHSGLTEIWRPSHTLQARIDKARELRERPVKRTRELRHFVEELISCLPAGETAAFVFEQWWDSTLPQRGYSPRDAVGFVETKWRSFKNDLDNIETQIRFSPRERLDLIGLPYQGALSRALERKHAEEAVRERARQTKLEADRVARVADLRNSALGQIGEEAEIWLLAANAGTGGLSPIDVTSDSEAGYEHAVRALHHRARRLRQSNERAN